MFPKNWYASKTVWFNVLTLIVSVASAFGFREFVADPAVDQAAFVMVVIINLALRFVTRQPLGKPTE